MKSFLLLCCYKKRLLLVCKTWVEVENKMFHVKHYVCESDYYLSGHLLKSITWLGVNQGLLSQTPLRILLFSAMLYNAHFIRMACSQ